MAVEIPGIGFLGAGQMAHALARGWVAAGLLDPGRSRASDPVEASRRRFSEGTGINAQADNPGVVAACRTLVLAVKPQSMPALLAEIAPLLTPDHRIITIAAGIPISRYQEKLGQGIRLVRVMPNTPCVVGASATGIATSEGATADDLYQAEKLFHAVGRAVRVPENLLDAVTGLSGSGPAFVYAIIEAMSDGGVRVGLPRDVATTLAAQTVLGAAKMVLESGLHPGQLKDTVTSPGGTTIAGLHALERGGIRAALMDAVQAAAQRSAELGK